MSIKLTPHNKSIIREYYIDIMKEISKDIEKIVNDMFRNTINSKYILKNKLTIDLTICLTKYINRLKITKELYNYDNIYNNNIYNEKIDEFYLDIREYLNIKTNYYFFALKVILNKYI